MTVEFAPARLPWQSALRNRLGAPAAFMTLRVSARLLACMAAACALGTLGACGARDSDARVALTTNAARELAQTQPATARSPALANAFTPAPDAASSNPPDQANSGAKRDASSAGITALAVRSPARAPAGEGAQGAPDEPLATPVIHSAD